MFGIPLGNGLFCKSLQTGHTLTEIGSRQLDWVSVFVYHHQDTHRRTATESSPSSHTYKCTSVSKDVSTTDFLL